MLAAFVAAVSIMFVNLLFVTNAFLVRTYSLLSLIAARNITFVVTFRPLAVSREPAEELLHRLRVLEKRDAFVVIADTLEIGPIQFAPLVRSDIRVRCSLAVLTSRPF